ncbi:MAG: hypothetical protein AMK69_26800 [Nitrospira bacterium SG8_3]|nr:MAG: hypothetical protein AMK69_26800 [Nitrospira bacterium SG8_3]
MALTLTEVVFQLNSVHDLLGNLIDRRKTVQTGFLSFWNSGPLSLHSCAKLYQNKIIHHYNPYIKRHIKHVMVLSKGKVFQLKEIKVF